MFYKFKKWIVQRVGDAITKFLIILRPFLSFNEKFIKFMADIMWASKLEEMITTQPALMKTWTEKIIFSFSKNINYKNMGSARKSCQLIKQI